MTSVKSRVLSLKCKLKDLVEPNFGLLDTLHAMRIITYQQLTQLHSCSVVHEINERLFDILETKDEEHCERFMKALSDKDQQHIVNYIWNKGGQYFFHFLIWNMMKIVIQYHNGNPMVTWRCHRCCFTYGGTVKPTIVR
jgi:hypothetical protein